MPLFHPLCHLLTPIVDLEIWGGLSLQAANFILTIPKFWPRFCLSLGLLRSRSQDSVRNTEICWGEGPREGERSFGPQRGQQKGGGMNRKPQTAAQFQERSGQANVSSQANMAHWKNLASQRNEATMGTLMSLMGRSPGAQGGPRVNAEVAPEGHQVGSQPTYAPAADVNISWSWTPHPSTYPNAGLPFLLCSCVLRRVVPSLVQS